MLVLRNAYDDRDITIIPRDRATGNDGTPVTLAIGDAGQAFEIDGDHELVISTRPREPGEERLNLINITGKPVDEVEGEKVDPAEGEKAPTKADADKAKAGEKA